ETTSSKGATIRCIDWLEESEGWTVGGNGRNNRVTQLKGPPMKQSATNLSGYDGQLL
ncbi:hypothetical protein HAX54_011952, partial [Datura stramonium]|nr:hypothetical protein [Datura stramonium]